RRLAGEPRADHLHAVHDLPPRRLRLGPGGDHGHFVAEADQLAAEIVRVALEPADLGRKVDALLEDLHPASQSAVSRGRPVRRWTTMSAIRRAAWPSP